MNDQKLTTIGLVMPKAFPVEPYESVHKRLVKKKDDYLKSWNQYAGAWNAVGYRFLSCTNHNRSFTESIQRAGNAPPPSERYIQERNLFGFFVSGLSTIESLLYGLYAIASIIMAEEFPIATVKDLKSINPEKTKNKFKAHFTNQSITDFLKRLIDDRNHKDWRDIRNILAHRASPGRHFSIGGNNIGKALWINGIPINEKTTSLRFKWLADAIINILNEIDIFTSNKF